MDSIREVISTTFSEEFPVRQPGVPFFFENTRYEQPRGSPWVHVAIVDNKSIRQNIGNPRQFRQMGIVNVSCMVPENTGTKRAREIVHSVFEILVDREWSLSPSGSLVTYGAERRTRGNINGWFTTNVMMEWRASFEMDRAQA